MNAQMFYAVIAFAILALAVFSFLVGGKSSKVKTLKARGDEKGFHENLFDLIKITVGSVIVLVVVVVTLVAMIFLAPGLLEVPMNSIGISDFFLFNIIATLVLACMVGFFLGVAVEEWIDKVNKKKNPAKALIPAVGILGVLFLIGRVAAETNITAEMQPVTDILSWSGTDMAPAVILLFLAFVPLIMVMIGVRFAGGMLSSILEGIREIFSFRF